MQYRFSIIGFWRKVRTYERKNRTLKAQHQVLTLVDNLLAKVSNLRVWNVYHKWMFCQKVSNSSFSLPLSIFDEVQYLQEFWNQDKKIYHVFRFFQAAYKIFNPIQNLLISGEKMLMSAEVWGCVKWFIYFVDLL